MKRKVLVVIRKNGDKFIPKLPVDLEAGDQIIVAREMMGSHVPEGKKWTVDGYGASGPRMLESDV